MQTNLNQHPLIRLLKLGEQPWVVLGLALRALLQTARDVVCVITLANAMNALMSGKNFTFSLVCMAIAMFSGAPINALNRYLFSRYQTYLRCILTQKLSDKLQRTSLAWLDEQPSGHLISVCTADLEKFIRWACSSAPEMLRIISYTIVAVGYCLTQSVVLTLCILPAIIASVPLISLISKPLESISAKQRKAASQSLQKTQEILLDPEFIKSYGLEEQMDERLGTSLRDRRKAEESSAVLQGILHGLAYLSSYLPGFIAAGAGTFFLLRGQLTVGFLISFVQIAVQRLGNIVPYLGGMISYTRQAAVSAKLILQIFDAPEEHSGTVTSFYEASSADVPEETRQISESVMELEQSKTAESDFKKTKRVLELRDVWFGYQKEDPVLRGINLHADQGELIALVGESGCGKSTLLKLLMGIYKNYQGDILLGGSQVSDWNTHALQNQIAPVFQQPFLFPLTIKENLCGTDAPVDEQILMHALEQAGLSSFINELPDGLNTMIDEQGVSLSGGQKQRMTIARAFLKDAPIILLDEPTSALDSVTESSFQTAFNKLRQGRTAIVVAHRLSTIQDADRIYVMEHGQIVQCGTHRELILADGPYQRLYESQDMHNQEAAV